MVESDSEKFKFCEFLRDQNGFHHWNDNFCSEIFVFHMQKVLAIIFNWDVYRLQKL